MSTQLNLAPESYQSSQRAKRKKQLATTIGIGVSALCGVIIVGAIIIFAGQKAYLAVLNGDIASRQKKVASYSELPDAVTAAQHLSSLGTLIDQKVVLTRFFEILQKVEPHSIAVSSLSLGADNRMEIEAAAKSYSLANKLAKALEAANVEIGDNASPQNVPHFTNVGLQSVTADGNGSVTFKMSADVGKEVVSGK